MLKILLREKEKRELQKQLDELRTAAEGFPKREQELETAIEQSNTDEEKQVVEESVEAFEAEKADNETKQNDLRAKIEEIENEIKELEGKSPDDQPAARAAENKITERTNTTMITNKRYKDFTHDERQALVAREDIKEFLQRVRELRAEKRGVTGAELAIPEYLLGVMREEVGEYSKLFRFLWVRRISGKGRQIITGTIPEGVWTEMIANFNEASLTFNQIELDGYKVSNFIPVPNSTLDDVSDINLLDEIYYGLVRGIGVALDKAIVYGTGVRMPTGIVTRLAQTAQPANWGSNAPTWTDLHETNILKLNINTSTGAEFFRSLMAAMAVASPKYGSSGLFWVMNRKTHMDIRAKALALTSGGAYVSTVTNTMPVIGGEIVELEFMADYDIVGGYGIQYDLVEREGATFRRSEEVRFIQDQTVFAAKARYDGTPAKGEGFVLINYNNTNPTTTTTFAADEANTDLVSLSALTIGATPVTLYPPFNKDILNYSATVTAHANKITATALNNGATVVIKNGDTTVNSGSNATFTAGENTLTVDVTNGNARKRTYTVIVTDATT